jgi:hypothetical protein
MNRNTLLCAARGALLVSVGFALYACSSASAPSAPAATAPATDAGTAVDTMSDDGGDASAMVIYPAAHASSPQVVDYGGPVVTSPIIVPVTFGSDPLQAEIDKFVAAFDTTTYWGDVTREYGASPAKAGTPVHLTDVPGATVDDAAIQALLADRLDGTHPEWPAASPQNVYVLFYPPGTTVTMQGGTSCTDFHGYHYEVPLKTAGKVAYAVISRCDTLPELPSATGVDYVAAVSSHEILEAITDPYPSSAPAYAATDQDHLAFSFFGLAELGDMCALIGQAFFTPPDFSYPVTRFWSNKIAADTHGHDPCIPQIASQPYFNAVPVLKDTVSFTVQGQSGKSKGVLIPVGQSKTIEIDLFSDEPTSGPFTVSVSGPPSATFKLDKSTGVNGDKLALTITSVSANTDYGSTPFVIA